MTSRRDRVFLVLGAGGFVGRNTVKMAVAAGWKVLGLVRTQAQADAIAKLGAQPVVGDALRPADWHDHLASTDVIVDLIQPKLPNRLSGATLSRISHYRQSVTRALTSAIVNLPQQHRPLYVSVSGIDDLQPDKSQLVSHRSPLREKNAGFSSIGLPVRQIIETAGIPAMYIYLATVYGAGKAWTASIIPRLQRRGFPILGDGTHRLPFVHVEDAAGAIVHLAGITAPQTVAKSYIVADDTHESYEEILNLTADLLSAPRPAHLPLWLARIVLGRAAFETLTRDVRIDNSALIDTGYRFHYPTYRQGMSATLAELGLLREAGK